MRVYLDSMAWIYYLEGSPLFGADAKTLVSLIRTKRHTMLSSFLVEGELLVMPKRNGDRFTEAAYKRYFSSASVVLVQYPPPSSDLYAELRARFRTKPADTLHATLAEAASADLFVTEDKKLLSATVPGIGRIVSIAQAISLL